MNHTWELEYDMKFSNEQAAAVGLVVGGKSGTALVSMAQGFEGRRIYVDGGSKKLSIPGPLIHLSGFTPAEVESLKGIVNVHEEYSSRVTGFLQLTPANLAASAKVVREATSAPYIKNAKVKVAGVDMNALFTAASQTTEEKPAEKTEEPAVDEAELQVA